MSKRYKALEKVIEKGKYYSLDEAVSLLKKSATAKFDETVDLGMHLGINIKKTEQTVRGTVLLPNGTGRVPKILVFAKGEKEKEAKEAGADYIGAEDLINKISGGWMDFDVAIATPDLMKDVGKLGKILGPKGLLPNPKSATVTFDLANTIKEFKKGKVEYKTDAGGNVHTIVGKVSFSPSNIKQNIEVLIDSVIKSKPASVKGQFIKSVTLSSTMGPAIKIDPRIFIKTQEGKEK